MTLNQASFQMKKIIALIICTLIGVVSAYAYVIMCPYEDDGGSGPRDGCLRVTRIKLDNEWVEADCDNVDPPQGWFLHNCE